MGFNVTHERGTLPVPKEGRYPADLGVYVNYRGKPFRLDMVGLLHISEWPDYWVEMEVPE